jgi:hypothetical protein
MAEIVSFKFLTSAVHKKILSWSILEKQKKSVVIYLFSCYGQQTWKKILVLNALRAPCRTKTKISCDSLFGCD